MSQGKRYKFQGSTFSVGTALEAVKVVTAITKANPAVVSVATHGYVDGDAVQFSGIVGMTELNGGTYVVDVLSAGTFALLGVDSTGYGAYVSESPNVEHVQRFTMLQFCELTAANQAGGAAALIDVTTICSTAKEFEVGLSDSGTLALDFNWAGNETVQAALQAANIAKTTLPFRVDFPNSGGSNIALGLVLSTSLQGAVDGAWKASASIKLTGSPVLLP